jgi:hypothetical protein
VWKEWNHTALADGLDDVNASATEASVDAEEYTCVSSLLEGHVLASLDALGHRRCQDGGPESSKDAQSRGELHFGCEFVRELTFWM